MHSFKIHSPFCGWYKTKSYHKYLMRVDIKGFLLYFLSEILIFFTQKTVDLKELLSQLHSYENHYLSTCVHDNA